MNFFLRTIQFKKIVRSVILFFFSLSTYAHASNGIKARYLLIELPGQQRVLSLAEVELYSQNKLISIKGKAIQSSTFASSLASRAIDGNTSGDYFKGSVTHTVKGSRPWWLLDLGYEQYITKIVIYNRVDCCIDRINPARLILTDTQYNVAWQENITKTNSKYEFQVSKQSSYKSAVSPNLLRNADFQTSTNPTIPDYWDLHHAVALKFKNIYGQYFLDSHIRPPLVSGKVRVLFIQNSKSEFNHLMLIPSRFHSPLPDGKYIFSFYVKSDRNKAIIKVRPGWAKGREISQLISKQWKRYQFVFDNSQWEDGYLQPIVIFPSKAKYYLSAPQLEHGTQPSEFRMAYEDEVLVNRNETNAVDDLPSSLFGIAAENPRERPELLIGFDRGYYTDDSVANLSITSNSGTKTIANLVCKATAENRIVIQKTEIAINPKEKKKIGIQISKIRKGIYSCDLSSVAQASIKASTKLRILPSNRIEVRVNKFRRIIEINHKPFYMVGIFVRSGDPPEWYFSDLVKHGFNTIFFNADFDKRGEYNITNLEKVVTNASSFGLKIIVGLSAAGAKPHDWRERLSKFTQLIVRLQKQSNIIGWYPVDEPAANSWTDNELKGIYGVIKTLDPYRLVFVNWAYDGIPKKIGLQPRGTLAASDFYSLDYYPFAGIGHDLSGFTETTIRVAETAALYHKVFHSWLQLFGGMSARREPTADELNYMAFLNFLFRGMIGYFDTKSNSEITWNRITAINEQGAMLADKLFLNDQAKEIVPPKVINPFIYSIWESGTKYYLLVVNNSRKTTEFKFKLTLLPKYFSGISVTSLSINRTVPVKGNELHDRFSGLEGRVYIIKSQ